MRQIEAMVARFRKALARVFGSISLAMAAAAVLVACSCFVPLTVSGSLAGGVVVELRSDDGVIRKAEVHQMTFSEVGHHHELRVVWALNGGAQLDAIHYARAPRGLKQTAPAESLAPGKIYAVEAIANGSWRSPACYARVYFAILEDGQVRPCDWPNKCLPLIGIPGPAEPR
jgi:hypothetical protein